jgi:putative ABC transport system permease protein
LSLLRTTLRTLGQRKWLAGAAIACLALGIGANTAVFSLIQGILLARPPWPEPERLVVVWGRFSERRLDSVFASGAELRDYRERADVFAGVAGYAPYFLNLTGRGEPERLTAARATVELFPLLGATPQLGRLFLPEEDRQGRNLVTLLSHRLWQRRFAGDPTIVGRDLTFNDISYRVVGVLPPEFDLGGRDFELWVPAAIDFASLPSRDLRGLNVLARLADGTSLATAQARMDALAAELAKEHPRSYPADSGWGIRLIRLHDQRVAATRPALYALAGAVALVLAIACANVANLLLSWALGRGREVAVRTALGASRRQLVRQFLAEGLVLALAGGTLGVLLALLLLSALPAIALEALPGRAAPLLSPAVLAFTAFVSLATGLVTTLAPALSGSRSDLAVAFKEGSRGAGSGRRTRRSRALLVTFEVAITVVVLAGAAFLVHAFLRLQTVQPGFETRSVATAQVSFSLTRFFAPAAQVERAAAMVGEIEGLTGAAAAVVTSVPFGRVQPYYLDARAESSASDSAPVGGELRMVSPRYFEVLAVRPLEGRAFDPTDGAESALVAIVDQAAAERLWPGRSPLGQRLRLEGQGVAGAWRQVVGVVPSLQSRDLASAPRPQIYLPFSQEPRPFLTLLARGLGGDVRPLLPTVRAAIARVDPTQPLADLRPLEELVRGSIAGPRAYAGVLSVFAAAACLLAAIGIYGVLATSVAERVREIGIRLALGAEAPRVLRATLAEGLRLAGGGLLLGYGLLAGIAWSTHEARAASWLSLGGSLARPLALTAVLILAVAALASLVPALRAARTDPVVSLRQD